ncbi:MAG: glycerophosphodiester phosphodiesterase [Actinomycetota bacterium]
MTRPIVVAHAGASGYAPANTFGAYRRAHATYTDVWMEFDAQFSSDDVLVAIHDDTLDRTTDGTGFVADRTANELQQVNAAASFPDWDFEPVARVRDILETGRDEGWRLICEVKNIPGQRRYEHTGESYAEALNTVLVETTFPLDRLVVICFWAPTLDALKKVNGEIALGYLSVPELPGGMGLTAAQNLEMCSERGFHVSAPRHSTPDLTVEHVASAHEAGIQVHVWTTNEPDEIEAAVSKDLDGITSDYPDRVLSALGR